MKKDPTWVTKQDSDRQTPLHVAARFNHTDVVKWLLDNGANVNAHPFSKSTPLHVTKNPEIVKLILERNPNLQQSADSRSPLLDAIQDLRDCTDSPYPALHMAIHMNYPQAVKLLLDAGCDIEIRNKSETTGSKGETALFCAAFWGHDEIAEMLIAALANVNAKTEKNVTPLHEAVSLGNFEIAKLLLENGADKYAEDDDGKTPLQLATSNPDSEKFIKLFSEYENSPNLSTTDQP